jgi:pyruvate dehydrogenase E2 component (dihydrolipoamide acetyltransferase)
VVDASRVLASPYAKKLLRESGSTQVRLGDIRGSGANGRVTAADVEKALASPPKAVAAKQSAAPAVPLAAVNEVFADVSLSGAAHARAVAATHAKQTVPHYYLSVDVNLEALMALRATANQGATQGTAVSVMDFAIKAAAASMRHVPEMNSSWLDSGVVRKYGQVDVNVFGGAGDALHAPLLKDAAAMGVGSIAAALGELSSQQPGDAITPGTFSVHNLGTVRSSSPRQ